MDNNLLIQWLRDAQERKTLGQNALASITRGVVANTLGGPVDLANTVLSLGKAGAGYAGHKMGLLSADQLPTIDDAPVGGSEWIGNKMQQMGLLGSYRNPMAEMVAGGLLGPATTAAVQARTPQIARGLLQMQENAARPSDMKMQRQRGAALAEFRDGQHYATSDLSQYTPKLYRQADITEADGYIPGSQSYHQPKVAWFTNDPEYALGQGQNAGGVLLEFDAKNMRGQLSMKKPSSAQAYKSGYAEFAAADATPQEFAQNLRSVTVPANVSGPMLRRIRSTAKAAGFAESVGPSGEIVFMKPE